MYSLDTNINTAVERQADRMHAVRAMNSSPTVQQSTPDEMDSGHLPALAHPKELAERVMSY